MSEVKRYFWNSDNLDGFGYGYMDSLADASSQELVCAYDFGAALARAASETLRANEAERREAALREELNMIRKAVPNSTRDLVSLQQRLTDAEKRLSLVEGLLRKVHCDFRPNISGAAWNEIVDEALGVRPAGCCCPPKGHTGIWAAAMCPVHFGLNRPGVKP